MDRSVRKWNLKTLELDSHFEERQNAKGAADNSAVQSIAWCRMPSRKAALAEELKNFVVMATAAGTIKLIDLTRNKVLQSVTLKLSLGGLKIGTLFDIAWNEAGRLAVASTSEDVPFLQFDL